MARTKPGRTSQKKQKNGQPERRGLEWDGPARGRSRIPSRSAAREGFSCSGVIAFFAVLALTIGACVGVVIAVEGIGTQLGLRESPVLQMTIMDCVVVPSGKSTTTNCEGSGDPGRSGVTSGLWKIDDADADYRFGTRLDVRCTPSGDCTVISMGGFAEDLAGLAVALFFASMGLLSWVLLTGNMFAPRRLALARQWLGQFRRITRRVTLGWFGVLGAMLVAAFVLGVLG
ncbi:hypothetical protein [Streptacidiphilus fuscans]|uniref:Uncharacterized protein n=1 Tax=Streptacidiphilus fuscans TaxID=2789292 RepID=A0A931B0C3_9ACTN|nr:hypothetical protein [Streptacidiphilus fuscans]MBF9068729.1 hypothetical protein [Streptacidiphilus fuscans]